MEIIPTVLVYLQSLLSVVLLYSVFYMSGCVLKQQVYGGMYAQDRSEKITIIVGLQRLFSFLHYDIGNVPKETLHTKLKDL